MQLYVDGEPVDRLEGPFFFVIAMGGTHNPHHFYTSEVRAAATARLMTDLHGGLFFVGQLRSSHEKNHELNKMVSLGYFGNRTWPVKYKPGVFGKQYGSLYRPAISVQSQA